MKRDLWCNPSIVCCGLALPAMALAQTSLPPLVVTATRTDVPAFDVPASIDRVDGDTLRAGRAQINLSDGLGAVPGLLARDRQNYAQDVQISVRGFGARSTFGIRGVRLYVDGIPATLPDGQGQITNVELGTVGRIEVMRGPFSSLYGNSSGGVLQVFTADPVGPPRVGLTVAGGSDDTYRIGATASGEVDGLGYVVGASRFVTGGYRDHSEADRRLGNAKLTWRPDADSRVTVVANSVALPRAQDPLGLSREQMEANPRGVDPAALDFDTRKTVEQTQAGITYERRLTPDHDLRVMVYGGHRGTEQYQSIPIGAQGSPTHPGGVIVLGRDYGGLDARWTWHTRALDFPLDVVTGLAYDKLTERREGYTNFTDPTTLGVRGELRRNEQNHAENLDPYVQASWQLGPKWTVNAGVRHSRVRFRSNDDHAVGANPNDSGDADFDATLPVLGAMYGVDERLHVYATVGRGFETPTLNELAYRPGGETGMNLALQPSRSTSAEAGVKWQPQGLGDWTAAVFQTRTSDEIVTLSNTGGRSRFQNAGRTRRNGLELGWSAAWFEHLQAQAAATYLDATYRDSFLTCTGTPCATPNTTIAGGNRIPGIARTAWTASVAWLPPAGWRGGVDVRHVGRVFVNDNNSDAAASATLTGAHAGYQWVTGAWEWGGFVRVDNVFDRTAVGSVIVNEGNGRYFEPAPGRTWLASLSATLRF